MPVQQMETSDPSRQLHPVSQSLSPLTAAPLSGEFSFACAQPRFLRCAWLCSDSIQRQSTRFSCLAGCASAPTASQDRSPMQADAVPNTAAHLDHANISRRRGAGCEAFPATFETSRRLYPFLMSVKGASRNLELRVPQHSCSWGRAGDASKSPEMKRPRRSQAYPQGRFRQQRRLSSDDGPRATDDVSHG